jgi:5-methylcytosine-specific restriction protein A
MLFTGQSGEQYGYKDGWTANGVFQYTGEGQRGDMELVRGNRAILQHAKASKDLHLFEQLTGGTVKYVGQMICTGYQQRTGPDVDGKQRKVIVFELVPVEAMELPPGAFPTATLPTPLGKLWSLDMDELRRLAKETPSKTATQVERRQKTYERSEAVRIYALRRANGVCEACDNPAPFMTQGGRPYLEPHHIRRLSDGGPDDPEWVAGVCPNCHRRAHHSTDAEEFNKILTMRVQKKEQNRRH